jgi:phage shock protein PspC (stress-responsive transcriptional regulator)
MNGTSRLYRSTSEAMLGGVAAGLGNYFKVDPTFVRLGFLVVTFLTGGTFLFVYLAMWLLIPTAGSTASDVGQVINENLNEMGKKVRSFVGGGTSANGQPGHTNGGNGNGNGNGGNGNPTHANGAPYNQANQSQLPQAGATSHHRYGIAPMILLAVGGFFLLANFGFFRHGHGGFWWPLLLIGLGAIMLSRRNRQ